MKPEKRRNSSLEAIAIGFTRWIGSPTSIIVHTILFAIVIATLVLNLFPFDVVILIFNTAVSLEAIYLALFIQMTVNVANKSIEEISEDVDEISEDIDEIQEDVDEIQKDVDEIQEDVDELQKDVEEMSEEANEDEQRDIQHQKTLSDIQADLRRLMDDIDRLNQQESTMTTGPAK